MCVMNTDDKYHSEKPPEKCLQEADKEKKKMHLVARLQQRRNFSPFVDSVDSVDRLMGLEATANLNRIASCLVKKLRQPY